jgi:tight adherence protein B
MTAIGVALAAAYGSFLLYTAALGWRGIGPGPTRRRRGRAHSASAWLAQAGLDDVPVVEFATVVGSVGLLGTVAGFAVFGAPLPAATLGLLCAAAPVAAWRQRRRVHRARAADAWPRIIEEIRILTASGGRSVPQALFEAGERAPAGLRPAFEAAHREWLLSTDFVRTLDLLTRRLADPTADAACETLLVAHEVGGTDLARRLEALVEDRTQDSQGRKDARAQQAGVRFARRFTLIVPLGMALAGVSVGTGRDAYQTPTGQAVVVVALALTVACWWWAGRIMRLPDERRVLVR